MGFLKYKQVALLFPSHGKTAREVQPWVNGNAPWPVWNRSSVCEIGGDLSTKNLPNCANFDCFHFFFKCFYLGSKVKTHPFLTKFFFGKKTYCGKLLDINDVQLLGGRCTQSQGRACSICWKGWGETSPLQGRFRHFKGVIMGGLTAGWTQDPYAVICWMIWWRLIPLDGHL